MKGRKATSGTALPGVAEDMDRITDGLDLNAERTRLVHKLGKVWAWLEANTASHPDYDKRERVWLSTLRKYEVTCAKLTLIEVELETTE